MSYFLIYGTEDGVKFKQFPNNYKLEEYLSDMFCDEVTNFMDYIPSDSEEFYDRQMIVIKGEVIKPEPVTIVKTFKVE